MADEIEDANVMRTWQADHLWHALIGPGDGRGLSCSAETPGAALRRLTLLCERLGWCFDDTWKPHA